MLDPPFIHIEITGGDGERLSLPYSFVRSEIN